MNYYEDDECNQYVGTDSTVFPSFMDKDVGSLPVKWIPLIFQINSVHFSGIWAFEPAICRSLGASYKSKDKYNGVPALRFELDMGEDKNVNKCFCRDEDTCPPKGTIDLYRCGGIPMIGSLPHFYLGDPKLVEAIESGLNPVKEKHEIAMLFEIVSAPPTSWKGPTIL